MVRAHPIAERLRFFRSFLASPRQVGSVVPTSRSTVRAMLDLADVPGARVVVELGAGTGVFTGEILRRLGSDARLLAFEIDPGLVDTLNRRFDDPRLRIVGDSAELLDEYLEGEPADVIVSVLPLTTLPASVRQTVMDKIAEALAPGGVLLVIQYSTVRKRELEQTFHSIHRRFSPVNIPPAFIFACREPRRPAVTP